MKLLLISFILLLGSFMFGQGNCLIFPEGSGERKACELCSKPRTSSQGSRASQMLFDSAIAVGPDYAWAYYQKSVAYLKRGFIKEGLEVLNTAVELEPENYLPYRAIWFWQYRNYKLCIRDLETYYGLPNSYMQFTPGGEKDMRMILGLAYAKKNNYKKALQTIEACIQENEPGNAVGMGDYHSLGILYVKTKQFDKAIETFEKQFTLSDDIPDSYYFLAMAYKGKSDFENAKINFKKALDCFQNKRRYSNPNAGFRVDITDVEHEIEELKNTD